MDYSVSMPVSGLTLYTWTALTSGAVATAIKPSGTQPIVGSFQTSAACSLEVSNNGTDWFILQDESGDPITHAGADFTEFSTSAVYIRPNSTATADVFISLRG